GCENVVTCQDVDTGRVLQAAIDSKQMTVIVSKCDSGNIKLPVITMDPVVIRDRFMNAVVS
ncbi:MAG: sulfopyruvate decarboxylase subunit beta, partial [Yoonia sp.]